MTNLRTLIVAGLAAAAGFTIASAQADDAAQTINVTLKDHVFTPSEIHVPANTRVDLAITNEDATPEEFDSHALHIEKVIAGGKSGTVKLRPLAKGTYPFTGEYHEATARGHVISE
jgi:plastocyanin